MEQQHIDDDPFVEISSSTTNQKVEAANELLEECWFFDNLLIRKQRMQRCYSDPCCPSSSSLSHFDQEMMGKSSEAKSSLIRTPSLPLHVGKYEKFEQEVKKSSTTPKKSLRELTRQTSHQKMLQTSHQKMLQTPTKSLNCVRRKEEVEDRRSKSDEKPVQRSLLRTPSLPPCLGREEKNQESVPPPRHKGYMTQCTSIPRYRPPIRFTEGESAELRRKSLSRKSLSDLEIEEVQGFKDLGFTFDTKDIAPSVVSILPGLQEKKHNEEVNPDMIRRPYLSEAWLVQSCNPPPPNLRVGRSAEDMKAQIKFWARSVASNVR